jgi:hypothetical protein
MRLKVSSSGDEMVLALEVPSGVLGLHVFDALAQLIWKVSPIALEPVFGFQANMAIVPLPADNATAVLGALKRAVGREDRLLSADAGISLSEALKELSEAIAQDESLSRETVGIAQDALSKLVGSRPPVQPVIPGKQGVRMAQKRQEFIPPLTRVVYGEVPPGYRESAPARALVRGEKYRIVIVGEEAFDVGRIDCVY